MAIKDTNLIGMFTLDSSDCWNWKQIIEIADYYGYGEEGREAIREAQDKEEAFDDLLERCKRKFDDEILSVDVRKSVEVVLTTGGPETGIEFFLDEDNEVYKASYYEIEWFQPKNYLYSLTDEETAILAERYNIAARI